MNENVAQAIKILNEGGIIIFPTDTAFGIGCRIDNEEAVAKLFRIRKRPETQATPVLVASIEMAQKYLLPIPEDVKEKLLKSFWPGALTVVLPCKTEKVNALVRGGRNNLGVRMPKHEVSLAIISGVGVPILGPSANFYGGKTPFRFEDLDQDLVKQVDYVVPDPAKQDLSERQTSTVIDCSVKPWKVLRQGAIVI